MRDKTLKKLDSDYLQAKPIPGCDGYFVSISGRVYSIKELTPRIHSDGYVRVSLYGKRGGHYKRFGIHQLLAKTYLTRGPLDNEVRHLDGIKSNNSIENLCWGTRKMNGEDMARHGSLKGEKNPKAILNREDVLNIRKAYLGSNRSEKFRKFLAKEHGVTLAAIEQILYRRNWKHI